MSLYAEIEDGVVVNLIECDADYATPLGLIIVGNGIIDIGYSYHENELYQFRSPKPYPSWNWGICTRCGPEPMETWRPPVPYPDDYFPSEMTPGNNNKIKYTWNEANQSWDLN